MHACIQTDRPTDSQSVSQSFRPTPWRYVGQLPAFCIQGDDWLSYILQPGWSCLIRFLLVHWVRLVHPYFARRHMVPIRATSWILSMCAEPYCCCAFASQLENCHSIDKSEQNTSSTYVCWIPRGTVWCDDLNTCFMGWDFREFQNNAWKAQRVLELMWNLSVLWLWSKI